MRSLTATHAALFLRALVATVLLAAGAIKLTESLQSRTRSVAAYGLFREPAARLIASLLPFVEIAIGAAILAGILLPLVAWAAAALFLAFGLTVAVNLARGRQIPCACFGTSEDRLTSWRHVALDVLLAATAAALAVVGTSTGENGGLPTLEALSVLASGVASVLLATAVGMASTLVDSRSRLITRVNAASQAHGGANIRFSGEREV